MISEEIINTRKEILKTEIQNLHNRVTELDQEKVSLLANINAMRGAIQQCDYFLDVLNSEKEKDEPEPEIDRD